MPVTTHMVVSIHTANISMHWEEQGDGKETSKGRHSDLQPQEIDSKDDVQGTKVDMVSPVDHGTKSTGVYRHQVNDFSNCRGFSGCMGHLQHLESKVGILYTLS